VPTANRLEAIWGTAPRSDAQRAVDNGEEAPTEWECDPIQVYVVGVNGTLLRLSNPDGR
jgi:hypothetical protein